MFASFLQFISFNMFHAFWPWSLWLLLHLATLSPALKWLKCDKDLMTFCTPRVCTWPARGQYPKLLCEHVLPWKWSCWKKMETKQDLNYTSVDPKQFTVSKFRLKPVILISECFCSRCGHTNHPPPPTWRETTGDNGRQDHFRAKEADHTNQHQGGQI